MARNETGRVLRFGMAGFLNTVICYALFVALLRWIPWWPAYAVAFVTGIALSYAMQTLLVFRVRPTWSTALRFPFVYVMQFLVASITMAALIEGFGLAPAWAALLTLGITVPLSYVAVRWTLTASGQVQGS